MDLYLIELSAQELVIIDKALQQMPYRDAAPLIHSINKQIVKRQSEEKTSTPLDENGVTL
jgi:hypothetical protein